MIRKIRIATILETEQSIAGVSIPENKSLVYIKDNMLNVKHDETSTWNAYNRDRKSTRLNSSHIQ